MMDLYSLEKIEDNLVIRGKLLQSMTATIYLRPEEILKALKLLTWPVVLGMPVIIVKGLWRILQSKEKKPE
jgi:hypothetical protein